MPKLVWRVKLVAELDPGVATETELARFERGEEAGLAELGLRLEEALWCMDRAGRLAEVRMGAGRCPAITQGRPACRSKRTRTAGTGSPSSGTG